MFSYQGSILAADDLRLTLSPSSSTRSRTCCTLTRFLTLVSRDPRSSLRVFDFRSTSNCFVACLGRSLTYLRTLTLFPRARFAHFSLLFVKVADWGSTSNRFVSAFLRFIFVIVLKVQGAFGACRSCRRSRRQGVIYHL